MQVILLEKVINLGNLGEIVKVKDGYARNFLIPSGRARRATETAKKEFEARRVELEKAAAAKLAESQAQGEKLAGTSVKLTQKAGVDGRLFGSVTNADVADPGVSDALAAALGLRAVEPLQALPAPPMNKLVTFVPHADADRVIDALAAAGAGALGDYDRCAWTGEGTGTFRPLSGAEPGPVIAVTAADVADYQSRIPSGQSLVPVAAGEKITERRPSEVDYGKGSVTIIPEREVHMSKDEMRAVAQGEIVVAPTGKEMMRVIFSLQTGFHCCTYICSFGG